MKRLLIICFALFTLTLGIQAQNVVREGNTFTRVTSKDTVSVKETKTQYKYKDSKGQEHPVWLSSTGKAFIKRVSAKTGKVYKQYLPEVGKQINPVAYAEEKKK